MSVQPMVEALNELIGLHQNLLHLADQKKQALTKNDIDKLSSIVKKEASFLKQITALDTQLVNKSEAFLHHQGITLNTNLTLTDLKKYIFKSDDRKKISDAQQNLTVLIDQLKEKNTLNQRLIQQSLEFINFSLDLFSETMDEAVYRNPNQQKSDRVRSGMFDTKA